MPDYSFESKPVCPHCGDEIQDAWELFRDMEETTEADCGSCEKTFTITRSVSFHYCAKGAGHE